MHRLRSIDHVEYGRVDEISLRLDGWLPGSQEKVPAVIIVHGGGWVGGDRRVDVQPLFKPLTDAGFAWFTISYRLAKKLTQFGIAVSDVQKAICYIKSHCVEYNIDSHRIALIGESAGAQLAAMATLRGGLETDVKAFVGFYMPSDLVRLVETSSYVPQQIRDAIRGTPSERVFLAGLAQLSPIENIRREMPHFLLIHGTADAVVPFEQSLIMRERMMKAGASCELYSVEHGGHGIRRWESPPHCAADYKRKLVAWLRAELGALNQSGLFLLNAEELQPDDEAQHLLAATRRGSSAERTAR